jgi:HD-GYP domain-containing protein (c-di-GMP phosphodiesterase class II)
LSQSAEPARPVERGAFRRRGRIVFTLAAVLVCVGLVPLGTVAWKLIDINREALTTSTQEYQLLLATAVADEVDIHVEGIRAQTTRMAQTLGGAVRRAAPPEELRRTLEGLLDARMPHLTYAYFSGTELRTITVGDRPREVQPLLEAAPRTWAKILSVGSPDETQRSILSDPVLAGGERPRAVVVASAPVVSRGRFRGVLSAVADLQGVWDSVSERNRTGHDVFGLDTAGRVFVSNSASMPPGSERTGSALVRRFLGGGRGRETLPFTDDEDGEERSYLGSYAVTDDGWGIFVQARLGEVYTPIRAMVDSIKQWALLALGLAVLAAIVLARTLSHPINRLAAASRAFAAGDFTARVQVRSGNEIGELAYTFNTMAEEIEDHIRRLRSAAQENRELFLDTIRAFAQAIDAKDPYTRGHSVRVNRYSVLIARELGLGPQEIADVHVASLMHDVGKIGIHDDILQKPGQLTPEEFEVMKSHPVLGANIMSRIRRMKRVLPGLRWHHERWKGGGYPDGLVGEQIPLMARIIAVADTFDAVTTHRPYQTAMTFSEALEVLSKLKGVGFEERIVEAFNRAYAKGLIRPEDIDPDARAGVPADGASRPGQAPPAPHTPQPVGG